MQRRPARSTTCGPGPPTQPQHAAAEGRAAAARARRPGRDRAARRLPARGRARRRSMRCACCATPPPPRGGSTPATTAARAELSATALARFRGDVLPAAGDWAAPHRAQLEEARAQLARDAARRAAAARRGRDRRARGGRRAPTRTRSGLWELLITALYRAGPPGRRARRLPARPRAAGRRARARARPAAAGARAPDPRPGPGAARAPAGQPAVAGGELVGRDDEVAALAGAARAGTGSSRSSGRAASARRRSRSRPAARSAAGGVWLVRLEAARDRRRGARHGDRRARA